MKTWFMGMTAALATALAPALAAAEEPAAPTAAAAGPRLAITYPTTAVVFRTSALGERQAGSSGGSGRNELLIAGLITLGAGYGGSLLGGAIFDSFLTDQDRLDGAGDTIDLLTIPVVGPWLGLANNEDTVRPNCLSQPYCDTGPLDLSSGLLVVGGVAQGVGVWMIVIGLMRGPSRSKAPDRQRVIMTSGAPGGGAMVHMRGNF